jgi:hypothetical protein
LTWPSPESGAVATKKTRCARMNAALRASMPSNVLPIAQV